MSRICVGIDKAPSIYDVLRNQFADINRENKRCQGQRSVFFCRCFCGFFGALELRKEIIDIDIDRMTCDAP